MELSGSITTLPGVIEGWVIQEPNSGWVQVTERLATVNAKIQNRSNTLRNGIAVLAKQIKERE